MITLRFVFYLYLNLFTGRTKNGNIFQAKKITPAVMEILSTPQKHLPINDLRALLKVYIDSRELKVGLCIIWFWFICFYLQYEHGIVYPDKKLAAVTGRLPFKLVKIASILKASNNLSE